MSDLVVENLNVHYDTSHILQGVSLKVPEGAAVAYLGGNGAGKTTTFKAIMGLKTPSSGKIAYGPNEITRSPAYERVNLGIAYVPSELQMFKLTVRENLRLAYNNPEESFEERLDRICEIFPALDKNIGVGAFTLSGGQQRMVTLARGLINNPQLLLLDEPTEGLAPEPRQKMIEALNRINDEGTSIVLIEHNLPVAFAVCNRAYVLRQGRIAFDGRIERIEQDPSLVTGIG